MDISNLANLAIIGAALSVVISFVKHFAGTSGNKAAVISIALSFVVAGVYVAFKDTSYWQTFLDILAIANIVYTFVLSHADDTIKSIVNTTTTPQS